MKFITLTLAILISNYTLAQSDLIFKAGFEYPMQKLNDTGITWSGEYPYGFNEDCTILTTLSIQDCIAGRDYTHNDDSDGHAGFSFTKLDANGDPLVDQSVDYSTTPWTCVKDNVTGLVWEVKTTSATHNADNTYRWGGLTALGREHSNREGEYNNDWNSLVQSSNEEMFCGFNNWRVPTVSELTSIANRGRVRPALDTNYFPNTNPKGLWTPFYGFWTSSPVAENNVTAWVVYSNVGHSYFDNRADYYRVRLVSKGH